MLEKGAWSRSCCTPFLRGYRVHLIDISIIYGRWSDRLLKPCRLREKKEKEKFYINRKKKMRSKLRLIFIITLITNATYEYETKQRYSNYVVNIHRGIYVNY